MTTILCITNTTLATKCTYKMFYLYELITCSTKQFFSLRQKPYPKTKKHQQWR